MNLSYLDQDEISRLLKDCVNISITKGTFTRYNQLGLILMPKKLTGASETSRRVGYHPFVPAELATAFLLFKGDWLKSDSPERIARATVQDVFLGRLLFYCRSLSNCSDGPYQQYFHDVAGYYTSVHALISDTVAFPDPIPMDVDVIGKCLDYYKAHVLKAFMESSMGGAYLRYIEESYGLTFLHLLNEIFPDYLR